MNGFYAVCAKSSELGCEVVIRFWRGFRCRFNGRESKELKGNGNEKSLFMLY